MSGDKRISPDVYFMGIALAVRERANCLGNRVGAVAVKEGRIISTGYNGTPEGTKNCLEGGCRRCASRDVYPSGTGYDLCICVHAEQNALLAAARFGISLQDSVMYTTMKPCFGCAKEMLQVKIKEIFYIHDWEPLESSRVEYDKIFSYFPGGVHKLDVADPRVEWALSKIREKGISDETGHTLL